MATASRTSIMLWHDSNIAEITWWYADVIGEVTQWHVNNINGSNIREVTKWYRGHWVRSWCQRQQLFIEQRAGLTSWELSVSQPHSGVCTLPSCRMSYTRASLVVSGFVMNFLSAENKLPAVISISFLNEIIFLTPGDPASLPHLVTASSRPSSLENPLENYACTMIMWLIPLWGRCQPQARAWSVNTCCFSFLATSCVDHLLSHSLLGLKAPRYHHVTWNMNGDITRDASVTTPVWHGCHFCDVSISPLSSNVWQRWKVVAGLRVA